MQTQKEFEISIAPLIELVSQEDTVIFSFPVNLNAKGDVEDGAVLFGAKALYLAREKNGEILSFPFEKITSARYDSFLGGAVCEVLYDGKWQEFCRSFASEKENLSQLVRILKEISDGVLSPRDARFTYRMTECPRCRRALPRGSQICPTCLGKRSSVKKLYGLIRPQMGWILVSMLLFFFTSGMNVVLPMIQGRLVDDYLTAADPAAVLSSFSSVVLVVGSMALIRILAVLFTILRNNTLSRISNKTVVELRHRIYESIQRLSVAGISRHTAGDLMNRVSGDTNIISQFLTTQLPNLLEQAIVIVFVTSLLFVYSWKMALSFLPPLRSCFSA